MRAGVLVFVAAALAVAWLASPATAGVATTITVTPAFASVTVGHEQCISIDVTDALDQPVGAAAVQLVGDGLGGNANTIPDQILTTDDNGHAQFCYTGAHPNYDNIQFVSDQNGNGHYDGGEVTAFASIHWIAPDLIQVTPAFQALTVNHEACIDIYATYGSAGVPGMALALVGDGLGGNANTIPDGTVTTDSTGHASYCYTGTHPNYDNIQFVSDQNGNGHYDGGETYAFASIHWLAANTAPTLTVPAAITVEATSAGGAHVTFAVSATDSEDSPAPTPTCDKSSGGLFALGTTIVACSVDDSGGLSDHASFQVTVRDTTPPAIAGTPADITAPATSAAGATVTYTTPTAADLVNGAVSVGCLPASGSIFPLGTTTVTCTATDARLNSAHTTFHVTVSVSYTIIGFLRPVDNSSSSIVNVAKAGSTVPLKFQVKNAAGAYVSDLSVVVSFTAGLVRCDSTDIPEDVITSTGGTTLRYDAGANQFIQNWKTPTIPGQCYRVAVTFVGGQQLTADFRLK
jgi:hypothetical protein